MEVSPAQEVTDRVNYGIGRPVAGAWLANLSGVISARKPQGTEFEPVIEPGVSFISGADIVEIPNNPLKDLNPSEATNLLDTSLEKLRSQVECAYILEGLGLKLNRYRVQDRGELGIRLRMSVYDHQIDQIGTRFWQIGEEKRSLRRSFRFPVASELRVGKRPEYWINLGTFVAKNGVEVSDIKEAIVPSLPRSPRFGGARVLNQEV